MAITVAITVLAAVFGTTSNGFDVTTICQSMVDPGNDDILVNIANFGDPDPGKTKSFGILFTDQAINNGNPIALGCTEDTLLDLVPIPQTATTSPQPPLAAAGQIKVIHAVYGYHGNGNDVTAICQAIVNQGNLTIPVGNDAMAPDPAVNFQKSFGILYTVNGTPHALACQESTYLTLIT